MPTNKLGMTECEESACYRKVFSRRSDGTLVCTVHHPDHPAGTAEKSAGTEHETER